MTTQLKFTLEIQEALNYERSHKLISLVQRLMEVLWLKSKGLSHKQIVELGDVSGNTMREYFRLYKEGGIEKLKEVKFYHPVSEMNTYATMLETYFSKNLPATIREAQNKIKELTGIERSTTQVREFLKNWVSVVGKLG